MTYGYTGDVLLPVTVTPAPPPAQPASRRTRTGWCASDICVPEEGDFRLDLPGGHRPPSAQAPLFAAFDRAGAAAVALAARWSAGDGTLFVQGPS